MDSDAESSLCFLAIGFTDGQAAKAKGQSQQQRQITEKRKRQIRPHRHMQSVADEHAAHTPRHQRIDDGACVF